MRKIIPAVSLAALLIGCAPSSSDQPVNVSGIYPHLAYYNNEGECGTGAVVPWGDRLWVITYGPHLPHGSSDKLYEITPDLRQIIRPESLGGTPANRMIHTESQQLFIGPYAIALDGTVRAIPYTTMQGRHTGNARHLTDPAGKIYYGTMEEGFYEVDVNTLEVNTIAADANNSKGGRLPEKGNRGYLNLPGAHGKGLYSGQGVMVYSNNGENNKYSTTRYDIESGSLHEWNGTEWKLVRRNQFVEVTGPGGLTGNANPATDPIWATGWDHRSILLGVRTPAEGWTFYRLPKASNTYDGAHGWNTEWPRIRDIGTGAAPDYLMTMHGMFWRFPATFTPSNSTGIEPRGAYLKVIGDFARWTVDGNDCLVFGCDDSAQKEFLNKRPQKGNIEGPGQSNSNLWFTSIGSPDSLGSTTASGAVWINDPVEANTPSEPMLFSGWKHRSAWLKNAGKQPTTFTLEADLEGNNRWTEVGSYTLAPGASQHIAFKESDRGVWLRARTDRATVASLSFCYAASDNRATTPDARFAGLATTQTITLDGGLLNGLGNDRRALGVLASSFNGSKSTEIGYYELDEKLNLVRKEDPEAASQIREHFAINFTHAEVQESSVLITDPIGRRWRLPLGNTAYRSLTNDRMLRICREVATERDLFNCAGTFYELPAENADGFAKIRPVASHNLRIHDYASYRGMLVMTGIDPAASANSHCIRSSDGKASVWVGTIDDLWTLGKPVGVGGPWLNTMVKANEPSDPYLIGHYDQRTVTLSHDATRTVTFTIELDPIGNGDWVTYGQTSADVGETPRFKLPSDVQARWIRFKTDTPCKATAQLEYR